MRFMRIVFALFALLASSFAQAQLTCEQFGAIAQETIRQRDQGRSLTRLLAEADRDMKHLGQRELALVKDVIRHSFEGTLWPSEVVEACKLGGTLVPTR